nr:integrase, catalytic region, zinc finger, CCHC-type, peptidase aspartic, catalytic [Tanacetum cinerariifolium]
MLRIKTRRDTIKQSDGMMCQGVRKEIQMKGVIDDSIHFDTLAIGAIGLPRPFKDGWHNSSIVQRSGTGRSPFPKTLTISKLGCVLSQDLVAFCLKTSCVLSQDLLRFVPRLTVFCLKTYCILSPGFLRPFQMGTVREPLAEGTEGAPHLGPEQPRVYSDLSLEEKDQYNADIRETNILLQGLPNDIYTLINHYTNAKDI